MNNQSLKQQAYNYIKHNIKLCKYMPGERINEQRIAEEMGIGRTPVREALMSLREEELVEVRPRKGTFVSEISEKQLNEIYQIRKLFEPRIAKEHISSYDKSTLLDFDNAFKELDKENDNYIEQHFNLDISFHSMIVNIAKNETLGIFFEKIMFIQYRLGALNSLLNNVSEEDYFKEHHDIIQALLKEDSSAIENVYTKHINQSYITSLQTLKICKKKL